MAEGSIFAFPEYVVEGYDTYGPGAPWPMEVAIEALKKDFCMWSGVENMLLNSFSNRMKNLLEKEPRIRPRKVRLKRDGADLRPIRRMWIIEPCAVMREPVVDPNRRAC